MKKIYYLHIPKTGGSALNNFLMSDKSTKRCIDHIEIKLGAIDNKDIITNYDFISGHIPFDKIKKMFNKKINNYVLLATFRNPYYHVLSHLTFVKEHISSRNRLDFQPDPIRKITLKMQDFDFSNSADLKQLIDWLEKEKLFLFHNTQTVYMSNQPSNRAISEKELEMGLANLKEIDYVGIQEELYTFMKFLSKKLDINKKYISKKIINPTKSRYGMDIEKKEIKIALERLICYDKILFKSVKNIYCSQIKYI